MLAAILQGLLEARRDRLNELAHLEKAFWEGPFHWRQEYQGWRVRGLRQEGTKYQINPNLRKPALIEALLAARLEALQASIDAERAAIAELTRYIETWGKNSERSKQTELERSRIDEKAASAR